MMSDSCDGEASSSKMSRQHFQQILRVLCFDAAAAKRLHRSPDQKWKG